MPCARVRGGSGSCRGSRARIQNHARTGDAPSVDRVVDSLSQARCSTASVSFIFLVLEQCGDLSGMTKLMPTSACLHGDRGGGQETDRGRRASERRRERIEERLADRESKRGICEAREARRRQQASGLQLELSPSSFLHPVVLPASTFRRRAPAFRLGRGPLIRQHASASPQTRNIFGKRRCVTRVTMGGVRFPQHANTLPAVRKPQTFGHCRLPCTLVTPRNPKP